MRTKKMMMAASLGILIFATARTVYGYWTDQIRVRENMALIWPVEVEVEEESDETTERMAEETSGEETEKILETVVGEYKNGETEAVTEKETAEEAQKEEKLQEETVQEEKGEHEKTAL